METKKCRVCKENKELKFFYRDKSRKGNFSFTCILCHKKYHILNSDKIKLQLKNYNILNKKIIQKQSKVWIQNNKDKIRIYDNKRYKNEPLYKLKKIIRVQILNSLKNKFTKSKLTIEILGCSFEEFKQYIESKFEPWMNWDNHGLYNGELNYGWDLDHIIPISSAKTEEDIYKLSHFSNLQPLCSYVNRNIKRNLTNYDIRYNNESEDAPKTNKNKKPKI